MLGSNVGIVIADKRARKRTAAAVGVGASVFADAYWQATVRSCKQASSAALLAKLGVADERGA